MAKNFKISIKTTNAAFEGENRPYELARILREVASDLENGVTYAVVTDSNGNRVGEWSA